MYDLVIRNGAIIDGGGEARFHGDLAIMDGRIAAIGAVEGRGKREIDAEGLIVAPGFVDPHTHYDAQVSWDSLLTPSPWHGVTSVVMGNCGVGLAPVKPDEHSREVATRDLVLVEQIPYEVLSAGIKWEWTSFADYMDAVDKRGCAVNTAFIAPLTPFRHWVMGEQSLERAATPEETASIKALLKEAVAAGALGFSTTILLNHNGYKGLPLAARQASREELKAYCNAMRELGKGVVEVGLTNIGMITSNELELLDLMTAESQRPVTWLALLDREDMPDMCQDALRQTEIFAARGARPQVSCRPLTLNIDMFNPVVLTRDMPSMQQAIGKSREALAALYASAEFRATFKADIAKGGYLFSGRWDLMTIHEAATRHVAALVGRALVDVARERGREPIDVFLDLAVEDGAGVSYNYEAFNVDESRVEKLLTDPRTIIGLSDAGAHVDMLCDASYTTYLLGHWVRERKALTLEYAVKRITSEPAEFFGLKDRGRIAVDAAADIVIFDADRVGSPRRPPEVRADLPGGGKRMITPAEGIVHVIVNGDPIFENGVHTGALPGRALRPH